VSQRAQLRRLRRLREEQARRNPSPRAHCPHTPHPKQAEFLALTCREALYGGAAGGGKSDALLMGALQYVHVPGYAAICFRRTYSDLALPGAIMDRAHDWLRGTDAHWDGTKKTFTFPSGATLSFGYMQHANDRFRYQGAEFQYAAFDELTQFPESAYRYILSRLRRPTGMPVPIRARGASNPGGVGHAWVKRRFVDPEAADEGRAFIPARLADNPSLDQEEYLLTLDQLDVQTRRQLRDGEWVQDGSGLVYQRPRTLQELPHADSWSRMLAMDFGVSNATSFSDLRWRPHDPTLYVVQSWKEVGLSPADAAERVRAMGAFDLIVGDLGGLGKAFAQEMLTRYQIPIEAAEKTNKLGYIRLFNGAVERGHVAVIEPTCAELLQEYEDLAWADDQQLKEAAGLPNHCADGVLYGWRAAWAFLAKELPPPRTSEQRMRDEEAALEREQEEAYAASASRAGRRAFTRRR